MFKNWEKKTLPLAVTLVLGCILVGCDKGDDVQIDPASPQSYMHDKAFMEKVDAREAKGNAIRAKHIKLRGELDALKAKDPTSPRLKEIEAEMGKLEADFQKNRKEMMAIVRERITPKKNFKEEKR